MPKSRENICGKKPSKKNCDRKSIKMFVTRNQEEMLATRKQSKKNCDRKSSEMFVARNQDEMFATRNRAKRIVTESQAKCLWQ